MFCKCGSILVSAIAQCNAEKDPGEPIYLTPLIQTGKLDLAKKLSRVERLDNVVLDSHSGYITVDETCGSNLFFWFFKAENKSSNLPFVIWLQGGPGSSSLYGVFVEHGPFVIHENQTLSRRIHRWNKDFNVLYVDNPVGTGFSFTNDESGLVESGSKVADHLHNALLQFFKLFPEYRNNKFFIAGESYGGKWGLLLADKIMSRAYQNNNDTFNINLQGIIIGSGFLDVTQLSGYSKMFSSLGLIDEEEYDYFKKQEEQFQNMAAQQNPAAFSIYSKLIGDVIGDSYFKDSTGFEYTNSITEWNNYPAVKYYEEFVMCNSTRRAIHVGNRKFAGNTNGIAVSKLRDLPQSPIPILTNLLNNGTRVLYYHGQMDVTLPYETNHRVIMSIPWNKADVFKNAKRIIWRKKGLNGKIEDIFGYVKACDNFWEVLVRSAGHAAIADKPEAVYDLISRFISGNDSTQQW